MHKACPREPMVERPVHWADRVWADANEPAFQLIWDATTGLELESGDLAGHRGEVAAEVRIVICTVRGSQLCCGAFGGTDLLRRQQCCREAIHLETSCQCDCINIRVRHASFEKQVPLALCFGERQQIGVELLLAGI